MACLYVHWLNTLRRSAVNMYGTVVRASPRTKYIWVGNAYEGGLSSIRPVFEGANFCDIG